VLLLDVAIVVLLSIRSLLGVVASVTAGTRILCFPSPAGTIFADFLTHATQCTRFPRFSRQRRRTKDICASRSEEHTPELQSRENLVCRLLLEKKNKDLHQ